MCRNRTTIEESSALRFSLLMLVSPVPEAEVYQPGEIVISARQEPCTNSKTALFTADAARLMTTSDRPIPSDAASRIAGLDVARAVAIGGMALIHFAVVLSDQTLESSAVGWAIDRLAGRPATIFMILAGIGVSLRLSRAHDEEGVATVRRSLRNRGLFFLVSGYAILAIWSADILRVYGIGFLLASTLFTTRNRTLWSAVAVSVAVFVALIFVIDFETNWDFDTLEYANLWTVSGGVMNLFYNGFRAVFPWVGLLFVGMLIGRRDLRCSQDRRRLLLAGLAIWLGTEALSFQLLKRTVPLVDGADLDSVIAIFGTDSLPSLPLFLLSSSGLAIVTIVSCIEFTEVTRPRLWRPLASAGRMAFTWYIAHIFVVISAGLLTGFRSDVPPPQMMLVWGTFFVFMVLFSWGYLQRPRHGPLEWLMRRMT